MKRLAPILLVHFIGTLGFSIVLPFLVALVTRLGGNALVYGLMGSTYSAFQLVGAPVLGRWSDRIGRRKVLLLSQLGTLAAWCVFLVALSLPERPLLAVDSLLLGSFVLTVPLALLFGARALDGLTGGNVSVANAYLADVTSEDERKASFGKMAVAGNLGFIVGPMIGGTLGATVYGEIPPVMAAILISGVAAAVIALYLPESRPCVLAQPPESGGVRKVFGQEQRDCYEVARPAKFGLRQVLGLRCVAYLLGLNFLLFVAFNLFYASFPIHLLQGRGWTTGDIGLFFSYLGTLMVIVQGPLLGRLSGKVADIVLVIVGGTILAAAFLVYPMSSTVSTYAGGALFALGNGLMWPSFLALLSKFAGEHQGVVQGYSGSVGSLASIIGLIAGGVLYSVLGAATFLVSAALVLSVVLLSMRFARAASAT